MRTVRFPIAGLMLAVLVVALGMAALRNASEVWAGATFLLTCAVLCLAVVGVVCREEAERSWWLGFALFGWGYLVLAFWSSLELPTMALLDACGSWFGVKVKFSGGMGGMGGGMMSAGIGPGGWIGPGDQPIRQIAQCLWALVAALLGGIAGRIFIGGAPERHEKRDLPIEAAAPAPRGWRPWLACVGLSCALILLLGLFGSRKAPGFWAGATFLLTCGLLGLAVLGAASGDGKRRQICLGAALFGVGYMALAFGRFENWGASPGLPTEHLLYTLRQWFPPVASGFPARSDATAAANARILQALEAQVPMHFAEETPLEDVLKSIHDATRGADGKGIPIYVDPIGLQEVERTMTSVVQIDLEGVALKTTLQHCLKQLALAYTVRDGLLVITWEQSELLAVDKDPFLIVGHCLLALLAAGFGGLVAPVVCRKGRDRAHGIRLAA